MNRNCILLKDDGNIPRIFQDIIIISFGLMISSFGIALFYRADMGSGAMATFNDGLHQLFNISYGRANLITNTVLLILLFLCDRTMINIGTVLCVCQIGIYVDMGNAVFDLLPIAVAPVYIRFICVLIGSGMMGVGLSLYVAVNRGFGALEGIVKYFCTKTGLSFGRVKIIQDLILILAGIMLNARWGIGTLVSAITVGPIMKIFISLFQKMLRRDS